MLDKSWDMSGKRKDTSSTHGIWFSTFCVPAGHPALQPGSGHLQPKTSRSTGHFYLQIDILCMTFQCQGKIHPWNLISLAQACVPLREAQCVRLYMDTYHGKWRSGVQQVLFAGLLAVPIGGTNRLRHPVNCRLRSHDSTSITATGLSSSALVRWQVN